MSTLSEMGSSTASTSKFWQFDRLTLEMFGSIFLFFLSTSLYYLLSVCVAPGLPSRLISVAALLIVLVTVIARVNDIHLGLRGKVWHTRRIGLIFVGLASVSTILSTQAPSWPETLFFVGVAITWFTTPGMPPWWRFVMGIDKPAS